MSRRAVPWLLLTLVGATSGCVERRFVITSDPPGALVYRNGQAIGTTPVDDSFVYYGKYDFTLMKDGYETLQAEEKVRAPWYQYPPIDFVSENIWPFKIRDVRRPHFQMQPLQTVRHDDVLNRGTELRRRGQGLGPFNPASVPARRGNRPAPAATASSPAVVAPPVVAPAPAAIAPTPLPAPSVASPSPSPFASPGLAPARPQ